MNSALKESLRIIDKNCKKCDVAKFINKQHGYQAKLDYCNKVCVYGKKIQELYKEVQFGERVRVGLECTEDNYLYLKTLHLTDKEISEKMGVSSSTLTYRKSKWGIKHQYQPMKLEEKTLEEYYDLKKDHLTDEEVASRWNVGRKSLIKWKKHHGIKGACYLKGRTKEEYLKLKLEEKTDLEIARLWGVWIKSLRDWKKEHNLRGGLK